MVVKSKLINVGRMNGLRAKGPNIIIWQSTGDEPDVAIFLKFIVYLEF